MRRRLIGPLSIIVVVLLFSGCLKYRMSVEWITEPGVYGPGDYGREIKFQGRTRIYKLHVPPAYEPSQETPVVLVFHGGGGYPGTVRYQSKMDEVADREKFIVVYPAGTQYKISKNRLLVWNAGICCGYAMENNVDDVGFVEALLDDLKSFFTIDENRIYATGHSNGALMCYRLASELSYRIAAIAPVAGQMAVGEYSSPPPRAVSVMHFHGLKDLDAPYYGGIGIGPTGTNFTPVPEVIESWVNHNGYPSEPSETYRVGNAVCTRYGPGENGTEVVLWTLEDGGHTWSGGPKRQYGIGVGRGPVNMDISASELMWEFFEQHPLKEGDL